MKSLKTLVRPLLFLVVVAGLIGGGVMLVQRKKQQLEEAPEFGMKSRPVTVSTVERGSLNVERHYLAVVEPHRTAHLTARVTAPVVEVRYDEGERVTAATVLVKLDGTEIQHRIEGVLAQVRQARADLAANEETIGALTSSLKYYESEARRYRRLAREDAVSRSDAEKANEQFSEVQGRVNAAKKTSESINHRIQSLQQQKQEFQTRLRYYTIEAPFDGVVAERLVDPGDMASPQKTLVTLEEQDALKLSFDVPQQDLAGVEEGAGIHFKAGGTSHQSEISLMYPSLDKAHMKRAEARLKPEVGAQLDSGAYVPVSVVIDRHKDVALLPRSTLIRSPGGQRHVFVVEKGHLTSRPVEVMGFTDDRAAVRGVTSGSQVVRNTFLGWARLSSGDRVEAVQ